MLADISELPALRTLRQQLEQRATLADREIVQLRHEIEITDELVQQLTEIGDAAERRAVAAELEVGAWYRSPWLWAAAGLVGTLAIELTAAILLGAI
jgi:hypothetical protein